MTVAQIIDQYKSGKLNQADAEKLIRKATGKGFEATVGVFRGNKTIEVKGNFKPFTKGAGTWQEIVDNIDEIKEALAKPTPQEDVKAKGAAELTKLANALDAKEKVA